MRSLFYFLVILITFYKTLVSANSCNIFLNDWVLKNEHEVISKSLQDLNSQDIDSKTREKWIDIWGSIPKDNYLQKINELEKSNYDAYLKFQHSRIFYSYTIYKDAEKINEWILIDTYLRNLGQTSEDLSLDLIIEINKSLTTHYSGSDRHGRLRVHGFKDDFYRFATDFNAYMAVDVKQAIEDLLKWYFINRNIRHPIELATIFYQRFITIHPFMDGNGRTGALLVGFILLKNGYPPPIYSDLKFAMMMRSVNPDKDVSLSDALFEMTEGIKTSIQILR